MTDDLIVEENEQFQLQLSSNDSAAILPHTNVSITIQDDDSEYLRSYAVINELTK